MGEIFAAIIAVERYQDAFLKPVIFAEADARGVSAALEALGCPIANQRLLVNERATVTAIDAEVRHLLETLSADDQCFLFFAGHGFSDGYHNYLAAHDTRSRDIARTSVNLQRLPAM